METGEIPLYRVLDEQSTVAFTGRVNILDRTTRQLLGVVILRDGQVFRAEYRGSKGLKAFYNIVLEGFQLVPQDFIIEPEIITESDRQIHYPYSVLKSRTDEILRRFKAVAGLRPPDAVKLITRDEFLEREGDVTEAEFQVLNTLCEWSQVKDLYAHCQLLDFEITEALVSLRKQNALSVIGTRKS